MAGGIGRLVTPPATRALLVLTALLFVYLLYGYTHFYRDPLSIFFSEEHGYDRFYSNHRQAEAAAFINTANTDDDASQTDLSGGGSDPQLCATFITVSRDTDEQYIDTAVGSFLANMSRAERETIHLKIFFADVPDPELQHPSYGPLTRMGHADAVYRYEDTLPNGKADSTMMDLEKLAADDPRMNETKKKRMVERKTLHDYAWAINQCLETTDSPYIAIFEDDILLADGWAARTLLHLKSVEQMMKDPAREYPKKGQIEPGTPNTWLYLRLFNQERSFGWSGGTGFFSNNVHYISVAVAIPLLAVLLFLRRSALSPAFSKHLDAGAMFVICVMAVPIFVWLFYASGKASLIGSPPGVHEEWFGCCNQAIVYNRVHAKPLAEYLFARSRRTAGGPGDMLTRNFAYDRGLARLSAYPMMAQHLGVISSSETTLDDAQKIWSMEYENFRPGRLAAEHVDAVRQLFGEDAALNMVKNPTTASEYPT